MNEENNMRKREVKNWVQPCKKGKKSNIYRDTEWTIAPMAQYMGKGGSVYKPRVVFVVIWIWIDSTAFHESQQKQYAEDRHILL